LQQQHVLRNGALFSAWWNSEQILIFAAQATQASLLAT
jgi:hypothetical protein